MKYYSFPLKGNFVNNAKQTRFISIRKKLVTARIKESWGVFNSIAKGAISQPNLRGNELVQTFVDIEDQIFYAIDLLVDYSTFVEDNVCYLLAEIAMGMIKSRKVYKGKRNKDRVEVGQGRTIGKPNLRLLSRGFDLFKFSRLPRDQASEKVKRVLRSMNLSGHVFENILRAFVRETKDYCGLSDQLVEAHLLLELDDDLDEKEITLLQNKIEDLKEELHFIEQAVGCSRHNRLYGVVRIVHGALAKIGMLQSRVHRSYQKLVPKPARQKGINENESLDLFQAGSLGLNRAISLFDVDSKSSFPTFANWWINQKILGAAKLSGPLIRLPWSLWETYQKVKRQELQFESDPNTRYDYTDEDVAKALGKSLKSIQKVKERVASVRLTSLDETVRREDGYDASVTFGNGIVDQSLEDSKKRDENLDQIRSLLKFLTDGEKRLVCLRFGIVEEIDNMNIDPKERAREILRQSACKAELCRFVTGQTQPT